MGIKGLRGLIKRECKLVDKPFEQTVPVSNFSGKKIVIDASIYLYTFKATHGEDFIKPFQEMINMFNNNDVLMLFLFDGVSFAEKTEVKKRRVESRTKQKIVVNRLKGDLQTYDETDIVSPELQNAHDIFLAKKMTECMVLSGFSKTVALDCIAKKENNIVELTRENVQELKNLLDFKCIEYITVDGEAEVVASSIVKQKMADVVVTKDSDAIACGAPIIITKFNTYKKECDIIIFKDVLDVFNLEYNNWLDLCIMCGTDYNTNIPKIGPVRSLENIKKHKTLESVSECIDTSILDYKNVRSLFSQVFKAPENIEFFKVEKKDIETLE